MEKYKQRKYGVILARIAGIVLVASIGKLVAGLPTEAIVLVAILAVLVVFTITDTAS